MLTNTAIKNAKPKEKLYKLPDEKGLYLAVTPSGGKLFRVDYRFAGKRKTLSLGVYPDVTLADARQGRDDARRLLAKGIDPSKRKKEKKIAQQELMDNSFEAVAREWYGKNVHAWTKKHASTVIRRLELYIFPPLGKRPVKQIAAPELLEALRKVEARGVLESAHRTKQICGQVFRYAIATGRAERDPSADLKGALAPVKPVHMAAITDPKKIGGLLRAIDDYDGQFITLCALKLAPFLFVRPGELRQAEWCEVDLDSAEWKIPAEKMKMKRPHIVPLSKQAVGILRDLHTVTGDGIFLFPSLRSTVRPMSNNTINAALRRMGYSKEEMTGHGFRSMASTMLHEQGWPSAVIELQLAHAERNSVKAAYNHAEHLSERTKMMQSWSDYLDGLKAGGNVIPLRRRAGNG